jgi:cytochrome d ubiquinol oxidase subunit II
MSVELLIGLFVVGGLTLYLVFGGADFGAGVWELILVGRDTRGNRDLINRAIGPVWETNHVWLVFVVVIVHSAFPTAYAALFQALWVPLLLALAGIVVRGSAFALRYHAEGAAGHETLWSAAFVGASALAPFFIGASLGAVADGGLEVTEAGQFRGSYLVGWLSPLALYVGLFTVGMCAYLAAVYLTRDASRETTADMADAWRRRALLTGVLVGGMAMLGLVVVAIGAPVLRDGFIDGAWPLVVLSLLSGWASLWLLWTRRYTLAVAGAGLTVASVVWGWALAQYPWIVPPVLTVEEAKASDTVLWTMVWSLVVGGVLVLPALAWLFYLFKGHNPQRE